MGFNSAFKGLKRVPIRLIKSGGQFDCSTETIIDTHKIETIGCSEIWFLNTRQWPRGLWDRSAEIVVWNPTGGMDVCSECCVLSSRGICDELITRPEESYRLWCDVVC